MKATKTYHIKEGRLKIELEKDYRGKFILPIYMDKPTNAVGEMVVFVNETDFDEDMKILIPESLGDDWFLACQNQLEKMIMAHNKKFGRILPADLELYCIESLIVMIAINDSSIQPLSTDQRKLIFKRLVIDISEALNIPLELRLK